MAFELNSSEPARYNLAKRSEDARPHSSFNLVSTVERLSCAPTTALRPHTAERVSHCVKARKTHNETQEDVLKHLYPHALMP